MKLTQVEPEQTVPGYNFELWESENGIWQVRLDRVMYGRRVHVGLKDSGEFQTEFCAGAMPEWHVALMGVVIKIVEQYPEDIPERELARIWPRWRIRPMFNDLRCWHQLCEMAGLEVEYEQAMLKHRYGIPLEELMRGMEDES